MSGTSLKVNTHQPGVVRVSTSLAAGCLLVLVACSGLTRANADDDSAAPLDPAPTESNVQTTRRGELLFLRCRACHALNREDGHRVGPNLAGLLGSVAGSREGFVYSDALASSDLVWTEEALDAFLTRPNDYFPGTKMAFGGIPDAEDRRQLIAYIKARSSESPLTR